MGILTEISTIPGRYRHHWTPKTPIGWLLFLLSAAVFIIGFRDKTLSKITQDEDLRKKLKITMCIVGFALLIAAVVADFIARNSS